MIEPYDIKRERYLELVSSFYEQNKPFSGAGNIRVEIIDARSGGNKCQLCGNRHLRYLCKIRNETGQEWLIGRECHTSLEELQSEEFKVAMNELITCSQCGKEQRRGELPAGAYSQRLCRKCWLQREVKNGKERIY